MSKMLQTEAGREPAAAVELITTADVAQLIKRSTKSVRRRPPPGRVTLGRSVRFIRCEVERWINAGCPAQISN